MKRFKTGASLLVIAAFLFVGVTAAFALPMEGDTLTNGVAQRKAGTNPVYNGWYTMYEFKADELGGAFQNSFCIDPTEITSIPQYKISYNFSNIDRALQSALQLSAYFFSGSSLYSQSVIQATIWNVLGMANNDNLRTNTLYTDVQYLIGNRNIWSGYGYTGLAFVRNPSSQDQIIHVSEPATMLLLGLGMIGLGITGRKKFFKK